MANLLGETNKEVFGRPSRSVHSCQIGERFVRSEEHRAVYRPARDAVSADLSQKKGSPKGHVTHLPESIDLKKILRAV